MTKLTNAEMISYLAIKFGITDEQADRVVEVLELGDVVDDESYDVMFAHYCEAGEMPYGTAKARDGDPYQWVSQRVTEELGIDA